MRGIAGETKIRRGDGGLAVECSILVDRLASLEEAQNIADDAKHEILAMDGGRSVVNANVQVRSTKDGTRPKIEIEEDVANALASVREIFQVSCVRVYAVEGGLRTGVDVEICVNPDLRVKEVHAVAKQARQIAEGVAGVDVADVHLELATSNHAIPQGVRTGSTSDQIVNGGPKFVSSDTAAAIEQVHKEAADAAEMARRDREDLSDHYSEDYHSATPSPAPARRQLRQNGEGVHFPQKSPYSAVSPASIPRHSPYTLSSPGSSFGGYTSGMSDTERDQVTRSRQLKREQRVTKMAEAEAVRPYLQRITDFLMQTVHYRRFKFEKRLISVGTSLADLDRGGRGQLNSEEFIAGLEKIEDGLGLGQGSAKGLPAASQIAVATFAMLTLLMQFENSSALRNQQQQQPRQAEHRSRSAPPLMLRHQWSRMMF